MVSSKINLPDTAMPRTMLTDSQWDTLSKILYWKGCIYQKPNHRKTFEAILYRLRVGCPWRDIPEQFGHWNPVFRRFNEWSKKGILTELFETLTNYADNEWTFIDGSIIKAHQHSAGASSSAHEHIGKSRDGHRSKIHLAVDSGGLPIKFTIMGGKVHDSKEAPSLIASLPETDVLIADKGYDSENLREQIREKKTIPIIPRRSNSRIGNQHMDGCLSRYRHLVENAFARLKHYRAIATRYDKLARNYTSTVALGCCLVWLPMWCD